MEITSSAEKLAQDWKLKIKDWNINAAFIADLPLADGIKTSVANEHGYYDHKKSFGPLGEIKFRMAIADIEKTHKEANLLAVFPDKNGQEIVWYKFENFMPPTTRDKRSGFGPANVYFLFNNGEGDKLVQQVKSDPTLLDALVAAKFPELATKVEVKPWKEILFLSQDLSLQNIESQIQVIASRG